MLPEMIKACSRNLPHKAAFLQGKRSITWREIDARSSRLALVMKACGMGRGDVTAIISHERLEVYEHWFASIKTGGIRIGINWRYSATEMAHILKDCCPKVLLVDAACADKVPEIEAELKEIGCTVIGFGDGHGLSLDYETLLSDTSGDFDAVVYSGDETVLYTYTSGTTGVPKGVMISERAVATALTNTALSLGVEKDDIFYRPAQSSWVVLVGHSSGLANGFTTVIPDGVFDVSTFLSDIARLKVTRTVLVPTVLQRILDEYRAHEYDITSLRTMIYGASPITPRLLRETMETLNCEIAQLYGLTEASGGYVSYLRYSDHLRGLTDRPELLSSAGQIGLHFEANIRDDNGNVLAPGEIGTLWLKGDSIMKGYLNMPDLTDAVLFPGGWLCTHDIGYIDDEGYLFLKDRKQSLIITGGVNVFATTVETVIAELAAVKEVAVLGVPDDEWGEIIVAAINLYDGVELSKEEVNIHCSNKLSRMECPKRIHFVDEIPKTMNGKIFKGKLKEFLINAK